MRWVPTAIVGGVIAVVAIVALGYYFLIRDDEADAAGARVVQVQVSNQVGQNGALVNPGVVFPAGSRQMAASVVLEGVKAGMRVRGTWYQLGVPEAPPEGTEARSSETILNADTISPEGRSRVSFSLTVSSGFSGNSVWLLRVYVNDALASTNGFAITTAAGAPSGGSAPPAGGAPPPAPRTYTVVPGDTLLIVAQKNLAPGANPATFATEIAQLNNLAPNAVLTPGQVLRLP
jgi:LysM repeat protein